MALEKSPSTNNPTTAMEGNHLSEDRIDEYVLQSILYGRNDISIEQHLFCCDQCQARIIEAWEFIETLRQAIAVTTGSSSADTVQKAYDSQDFRSLRIAVN